MKEIVSNFGLVHLYCGDGKGKTTAAMGLALRAVANGFGVVIVQFLKSGISSEISFLQKLPEVVVLANQGLDSCLKNNSPEFLQLCLKAHRQNFFQAVQICQQEGCRLLVLDEVVAALNKGVMDKELILEFLKNHPANTEIVLTGRNPSQELIELADYVSEVKKVKHPFEKGVAARLGIEY